MIVITGDQRECISALVGPSGPANTMNVRIRGVRHIVIDNVRDLTDINAARSDVGGYQHLKSSVAEAVKSGLTTALGKIPLQ